MVKSGDALALKKCHCLRARLILKITPQVF